MCKAASFRREEALNGLGGDQKPSHLHEKSVPPLKGRDPRDTLRGAELRPA